MLKGRLREPFTTRSSITCYLLWNRILMYGPQIKADRGEIDSSADTIKQLQEESVKLAQKTHESSGDEAKTDLK